MDLITFKLRPVSYMGQNVLVKVKFWIYLKLWQHTTQLRKKSILFNRSKWTHCSCKFPLIFFLAFILNNVFFASVSNSFCWEFYLMCLKIIIFLGLVFAGPFFYLHNFVSVKLCILKYYFPLKAIKFLLHPSNSIVKSFRSLIFFNNIAVLKKSHSLKYS